MSKLRPAHDLSHDALGGPLRISNGSFIDNHGRTLCLRGLNVSGASKLPTEPNGLSHLTDGFYEHRTVTFTGRPFPLEEAPLHFRRLQAWGLPLVRLLVTWESIGHAGPNPTTDLDLEYIAYLRALIELMPKYGIKCFICGHQDVWSRFSGGSGAPGWTFEAAGLDLEAFTQTGAAYVHGQDEKRRADEGTDPREPSGPFLWPSGYQKLAASTMATLFWAGDALAPQLKCRRELNDGRGGIEEVSIQTYLQDAFIEAYGRLADEVGHLEACIGFDPINEPHRGLINLHGFHGWNYDTDLHIGHYPSLAQSLALGSGYAQKVDFYVKSWPWPTRISHKSFVDPKGRSAWLASTADDSISMSSTGMGECVWRAHGVWEWDEKKKAPVILQPTYFDYDHRPGREGKKLEWYRDFYGPFIERYTARVSRGRPHSLSVIEPIPNEFIPPWAVGEKEAGTAQKYAAQTTIDTPHPQNLVYSPHFYDLNVLFSKAHAWMSVNVQGLSRGMFPTKALYFGAGGLRKNYRTQIGNIVKYGHLSVGRDIPTLIGEVGIPFDVNEKFAYSTGRYDVQRDLMHALIGAMEDNHVHFTLWNYNPQHRIEYGDGWNKEDFSVINGDDITEPASIHLDYRNQDHESDELYRGGRVLDVIIRPYAAKVAGQPLRSSWDRRTLRYEFEWKSVAATEQKHMEKAFLTEVFMPNYHYANHEVKVQVSDGTFILDKERQTLYIRHRVHEGEAHHKVTVEIAEVEKHFVAITQQRRRGSPSPVWDAVVPIAWEIWWEGVEMGSVVVVLMAILVAIAAALVVLLG